MSATYQSTLISFVANISADANPYLATAEYLSSQLQVRIFLIPNKFTSRVLTLLLLGISLFLSPLGPDGYLD